MSCTHNLRLLFDTTEETDFLVLLLNNVVCKARGNIFIYLNGTVKSHAAAIYAYSNLVVLMARYIGRPKLHKVYSPLMYLQANKYVRLLHFNCINYKPL